MTVKPFAALRPRPEHAAQVAALPYDVMNTEEARQMASPLSFLHVDKAEIDLPEGTDPYSDAVYARAAKNLAKLQSDGYLIEETAPCFYIYRLTWRRTDGTGEITRTQTGLGALVSVKEYEQNLIKKHELTRPDKEMDRIKHIVATQAHTGPIFLTYRHEEGNMLKDTIWAYASMSKPEYNFVQELPGGDSVEHSLWVVKQEGEMRRIQDYYRKIPALYIADGHHRNEAAYKAAAQLEGKGEADFYLGVIFPHTDLEILDYNRVLMDLNGHSPESLLAELAKLGKLEESPAPFKPARKYEYGFYLSNRWYRLTLDAPVSGTVIGGLDAALLQEKVLAPLFGIADPRADKRIDFVGGIRGLAELARRVDSGECKAAFSLFPTSMEELLAVADAGEIMPPKSTWFEPKLLSGLLIHKI